MACELPSDHGAPLSRWISEELARHAQRSGLVATVSGSTVWRWLREDAIRPWQHRCWIFPRDPDFAAKAGRILDLYERRWKRRPLREGDFVIYAEESTGIQASRQRHDSAWFCIPECSLFPRGALGAIERIRQTLRACIAQPFKWTVTRTDLKALMRKLEHIQSPNRAVA